MEELLLAAVVVVVVGRLVLLEWPNLRAFYYLWKIPGVWGWPLVGVGPTIALQKEEELLKYFTKITKQNPRFVSCNFAGIPVVFLLDTEDIKRILGSRTHVDKGFEYSVLKSWLNDSLLLSRGAKWKSRRKLLTPSFHSNIIEKSFDSMSQNVDIFVKKLMKHVGSEVEIETLSSPLFLDMVADYAFGIELGSQSKEDCKHLHYVTKVTKAMVNRVMSLWKFKDYPFYWTAEGRRYLYDIKQLHQLTDKIITERIKCFDEMKSMDEQPCRNEDSEVKEKKSYLDLIIETEYNNPGTFSPLDMREEVDGAILGAHDTSSSTTCFTLLEVASHPEIQDKLHREIEEVLGGKEGRITLEDVQKMEYVENVVKETLRMYPAVPYISRRLTSDCILDDGTVLASSTNLLVLPALIHKDPRYWEQPDRFNPDRFSPEQAASRPKFSYLPFSAGPRNCIGQSFAMLELKLVLAEVVRNFTVSTVTEREDVVLVPNLVLRSTEPIKVRFTPRTQLV